MALVTSATTFAATASISASVRVFLPWLRVTLASDFGAWVRGFFLYLSRASSQRPGKSLRAFTRHNSSLLPLFLKKL